MKSLAPAGSAALPEGLCLSPPEYDVVLVTPNRTTLTGIFVAQTRCCQRSEDLQYSCQNCATRHMNAHLFSTFLSVHSVHVQQLSRPPCFTFSCLFLFFPFFLFSVCSSPPSSFLAVCENREEPWPRFQYLWRHQRPGEPLQTLRHGTT